MNNEIEFLSKGSKVLDILVSIVLGKLNLIQYREEMRIHDPEVPVRCPVCGAEDFDRTGEQEIAKQAEDYQAEHKELIEKKKKEVNDLQQEKKELLAERMRKVENALKLAVEAAKKETECLTRLYQQSKVYFDAKLSLLDEKGYSLLNIFSDGQLSVFMLSYFLGIIFRMSKTEKIPVYFVDDITACMDDINMLAFLDFIKYQLSEKNNVMKQLFFVTCDKRIESLIKYKMQSCGIFYKEIGMQEFRDRK